MIHEQARTNTVYMNIERMIKGCLELTSHKIVKKECSRMDGATVVDKNVKKSNRKQKQSI